MLVQCIDLGEWALEALHVPQAADDHLYRVCPESPHALDLVEGASVCAGLDVEPGVGHKRVGATDGNSEVVVGRCDFYELCQPNALLGLRVAIDVL